MDNVPNRGPGDSLTHQSGPSLSPFAVSNTTIGIPAFAGMPNAVAPTPPTMLILSEPQVQIDDDFYGWLLDQASRLRRFRPAPLDWENLAEELEAMARKDRKALRSHLKNLLSHLLKWHYQPNHRCKSWQKTIDDSRDEIEDLLDESGSLWNVLKEVFAESKAYARAVRDAVRETGPLSYPAQSPWTLKQVLDHSLPLDLHDPLNA